MIIYRYKAYDSKGMIHSGNLFVTNEEEAISLLLSNNLTPIEIKLLPQSFLNQILFRLFFRITFHQKIFLIRSLYLILKSGVSLNKGLEMLINETKGSLKDFLFFLNYNLHRGEPLYKTFANFSQTFSRVEVEIIKSGEISGNLIKNLEKLAENLERQREIKGEIISSLIYPSIVLGLSLVVIVLLVTFVMPRISILINQFASRPPLLTRILLVLSNFINNNFSLIFHSLIFIIVLIILIFSIKRFRDFLFKIILSLPLISETYFDFSLAQAFFILRSLLNAGINLTQALILSAHANPNKNIRDAFLEIEKGLRAGGRFRDLLVSQKKIPNFTANILGVASEAGFLEEALKNMEEFYLGEFRRKTKNLLNLLQPALLIFVGTVVGFVAIAILVPIYQQISEQLQFQGRGQIPGEVR